MLTSSLSACLALRELPSGIWRSVHLALLHRRLARVWPRCSDARRAGGHVLLLLLLRRLLLLLRLARLLSPRHWRLRTSGLLEL